MISQTNPDVTSLDIPNPSKYIILKRTDNILAQLSFKIFHNVLVCGKILHKWTNINRNCPTCQSFTWYPTNGYTSLWRHCTVHTCFVWAPMLGGVVWGHTVKTPNAYYCYFHMEILYVDIYKFVFFLDYTTWWIYILSHFGSILLCNLNPDADR